MDKSEYGLSEAKLYDVQFDPSDFGILQKYSEVKQLYIMALSPTIITLTTNKETEEPVIMKQIQKSKLMDEVGVNFARTECAVHSQFDHDNIVKLYEYTENESEFVLFMEYCNDANYFDDKLVERLTPITNQDKLQQYSLDILSGLQHVHEKGIIHSDMKLQNLLLQRPTPEEKAQGELPIVKICDFGLSHIMDADGHSQMVHRCGTNGYIAPEVGSSNTTIGPEIDMWAFGVMLYEMCTAYKPTKLLNYRYGSGPIPYRERDWRKHNRQIKDLIEKCLVVDPKKRIMPDEALSHPWFESE